MPDPLLDVNTQINEFRLASRELFNGYFRMVDPYNDTGRAWELEEYFWRVEAILFESLVIQQTDAASIRYGAVNPSILVTHGSSSRKPLMLNRSPGRWDHPVKYASSDAVFHFIEFFDWDQLGYRDNRYVRVQVGKWPDKGELIGKHALIETQYVRYEIA